jgi:predicted DNA-binding protein (MmcQ/YjbR family)
MYSDDDPYLAELREVCLAFPEAVEAETWGWPTFRAGKKIFAAGRQPDTFGVIFKPEADERLALVEDPRCFAPPFWGPSGWLELELDAAPVDWAEVRELLEGSYRQVALKRMIKALDAELAASTPSMSTSSTGRSTPTPTVCPHRARRRSTQVLPAPSRGGVRLPAAQPPRQGCPAPSCADTRHSPRGPTRSAARARTSPRRTLSGRRGRSDRRRRRVRW